MDELHLVVREPRKAYVDDMLWLPKALVSEKAIKGALEFWEPGDDQQPVFRRLWQEAHHHLICPREFVKIKDYPQFPFPFIDLRPRTFSKSGIIVKSKLRDSDQIRADSAFASAHAGILNLACGKGKTFLALKRIAELGCPALIIVHNTFLMDQWVNKAIPEHVELPSGEKVGIIQGPVFDWRHPITVAMIHSLAARAEEGRIPPDFRRWFGAGIWDEVPHLSAPTFLPTAPIILGLRFGLTATDKRADGTDFIYKYHIGDIFYTDLVQKLIPRVYFQCTPVYFDLSNTKKINDNTGTLHLGKLRTFMGNLAESNSFRAKCIQEALNEGRKIIAISASKNQLENLHEMFPGSGLVVRETPQEDRNDIVRQSQLTFAIDRLGSEGLDDNSLDTVFVLLPFGGRHDPPNALQQVMGRIQREKPGRNTPVVVIFDDMHIPPLHAMANIMRHHLKHWDKHVPGMPALSFQNFRAP